MVEPYICDPSKKEVASLNCSIHGLVPHSMERYHSEVVFFDIVIVIMIGDSDIMRDIRFVICL